MATAELVRAYLDWQSEMGTEEVILPHPLIKRQASGSPHAATGPGSAVSSGYSGQPTAGQTAISRPVHQPILSQSSPANAAVQPGSTAPSDLFQSLVHSLESAGDARREAMQLPGAPKSAPIRPSEALNLPVFADLDAYWAHLEKHPAMACGALDAGAAGPGAIARLVRGCGPVKAALALVGFEPSEADAAEGMAFRGEAGILLEKMMRAIRLETRELYLTQLIKVPVPGKTWSRRELNRILPLLHAELALVQAPMVLILGQECAQTVLKTGKTVEELRQETHFMEGRPFFVTYHPQELLRKEELKRKAWEDLQWLQRRMAEMKALP